MNKQGKRRFGCVRWIGYGIVGIIALFGCGLIANIISPQTANVTERSHVASVSTDTPAPIKVLAATESPTEIPTPAPTATPVAAIFGSEMSAWTAFYGEPVLRFGYQVFGSWEILPLPGGRVRHMERVYDPYTTLENARIDVAAMLPVDATIVRSYSPDTSPEILVDLYGSPILLSALPSDAWVNAEPGQFAVLYYSYPDGVSRVVIASGNNVTGAK